MGAEGQKEREERVEEKKMEERKGGK